MSNTTNVFNWDKAKFTTLVDSMDHEHEGLINLMNQLYRENEANAGKAQLMKTLQQLGAKTKDHFAHEEKFFSSLSNYRLTDPHKKIHQELLNRFQEHAQNFIQGSATKLSDDFFTFLKVWLSAHICGVDRKYGEAAQTKSA